MRKALAIAKTIALFGVRQLFGGPIVRRILYTKYEHLAIIMINIMSIVMVLALSYAYGIELFINPWKPNIFVDTILAFLFIFLLIGVVFSSAKGVGLLPGYEFLLYQPVDFGELVIGIMIGVVLQTITVFMLIAFIPLTIFLLSISLGYVLPILKSVVSFILLIIHLTVSYMPLAFVLDIAKTLLLRRKEEYSFLPMYVFVFIYILIGISHSVILSIDSGSPIISPILILPVKAFYIIAFEISKFIGFAGYIFGLLALFCLYYALLRYVGQFLGVEDFMSVKDVYELRLAKQLEKEFKRKPLISWSSPEEVLKQVLIDLSPLNPRNNIKSYAIAFSIAICIAFILRTISTRIPYTTVEYLNTFWWSITSGIMMLMHMPLVNELLFNDLRSLWILKVYSCNDLPFVKILNIKYLSYLGIAMTILSLFNAIVFQSFYLVFLPLLNLPFICLSINLLIIFGLRYLRKHKGRPPHILGTAGGTPPDISAFVLVLPILLFMVGSSLFYSLIAAGILTGINLVLALTVCIFVFVLLNMLLTNLVAKWLTKTELY